MSKLRKLLAQWLGKPGLRRVLAGMTLATCSLTAVLASAAEAGGHGGGEPHINWWQWSDHAPPVGWFWLNWILFVVGLVYLARKPVVAAFTQRHLRIKEAVETAAASLTQAQDRYEDFRGRLANVEKEAAEFVDHGRSDGALERDQIISTAKEYAERLRLDSQAVQQQEVQKAILRLRRAEAHEVLLQAEQMLTSKLGDADRARLVEDTIAQLENGEVAPAGEHHVRGAVQTAPAAGGAA